MVTKEQVLEALKNCYDPEIPVNIVDLGLIYDLKVDGGSVYVKMTLTAPGCPAHVFLKEQVEQEILRIPGVERAEVEIVWDPPWTPERMSEEAKRQLGFYGPQQPPVPLDMKPVRAGSKRITQDGTILLANSRGEVFRVSEDVAQIWDMCDGTKSVGELAAAFAERLGTSQENVEGQVAQIVAEMLGLGLLANPDEFVQLDLA